MSGPTLIRALSKGRAHRLPGLLPGLPHVPSSVPSHVHVVLTQIEYTGPALASATVYHWDVTVVTVVTDVDNPDPDGVTIAAPVTSAPASFSMGILSLSDWAGNDTVPCAKPERV